MCDGGFGGGGEEGGERERQTDREGVSMWLDKTKTKNSIAERERHTHTHTHTQKREKRREKVADVGRISRQFQQQQLTFFLLLLQRPRA